MRPTPDFVALWASVPAEGAGGASSSTASAAYAAAQEAMIADQIVARGITDRRILAALRDVPRHAFVPEPLRAQAYADTPLPIGHDQTISQPFIVALMSSLARPQPSDAALEIGTGTGYQAAVLSRLVGRVVTLERIEALADAARARLEDLGYDNLQVRHGDGFQGWPDAAPFDLILVTAAPATVPPALLAQLKPGGRMIVPVGAPSSVQDLLVVEKDCAGTALTRRVIPVRFVPMIGDA
jgi:protein-L-isoaspartate(D-aspartate) O-methyltransferase